MVLLVILDHIVFKFTLKDLGLKRMILRKVKLMQGLPCLNISPGKGDNILKALSIFAIIVAKLVITNLAASSRNPVSISMIVSILGKGMRDYV
jgi:hypothetical protein